jgi:hypothetical protein
MNYTAKKENGPGPQFRDKAFRKIGKYRNGD